MMSGMRHRRRHASRAQRAGVLVAVAALLAGCSATDPPEKDRPDQPESAALRVQTVSGGDGLDERTRTTVEGAVGDVLSEYVYEAFLGDFPRQEFVRSFEPFTSEAASEGARKIDVMTAATASDATSVRATRLDARLSFVSQAGKAYAGSARVAFSFEASFEDGSTRTLVLDGRMFLDTDGETWRIFGYDLTLDDGIVVEAES